MVGGMQPIKIAALTPAGAGVARRLCQALEGAAWPGGSRPPGAEPGGTNLSTAWPESSPPPSPRVPASWPSWPQVLSCASVAPLLQGKDRDPAVVVVDEGGRFAVSLLSGHLGGANELARRVAEALGGTPVITTATDIQGLPALDLLAAQNGLAIDNLAEAKAVSMALLSGQPVRLVDPEGFLAAALEEYTRALSPGRRSGRGPGPGLRAHGVRGL